MLTATRPQQCSTFSTVLKASPVPLILPQHAPEYPNQLIPWRKVTNDELTMITLMENEASSMIKQSEESLPAKPQPLQVCVHLCKWYSQNTTLCWCN